MDDALKPDSHLNRRRALGAAVALPFAVIGGGAAGASLAPSGRLCILTPQSVEGPFYFDPHLVRSDVTEGRPGVPLVLRMIILEAGPCTPLSGSRVDIWSAGADGEYSGYTGGLGGSGSAGTFLRGTQVTDEAGQVVFRTAYPAYYPGRTPHIHFKVFLDDRNVLMGQTYFPDALSEYLFSNVSAYRGRSQARDTYNSTDMLARMDPGRLAFCDVKEAADHYAATLIVGVDRQGVVLSGGPDVAPPGSPPPGPSPGPRRPNEPAIIVPGVPLSAQRQA